MDHVPTYAESCEALPASTMPTLQNAFQRQEVRCAVRFPLTLPAVVFDEGREYAGTTKNISASGVLLALDHDVEVGRNLRFSFSMPGQVLGIQHDVLVDCSGRVVRCCLSEDLHLVAATIDEYQFMAQ